MPEYLEAAVKSVDGEELAAFEEACRETYDRMARISIVPTGRVTSTSAPAASRLPPGADLQKD